MESLLVSDGGKAGTEEAVTTQIYLPHTHARQEVGSIVSRRGYHVYLVQKIRAHYPQPTLLSRTLMETLEEIGMESLR